jgi:hypothetical protein
LIAYLGEHAPLGRLAASRGAEAMLARACVVLGAGCWRSTVSSLLTDWESAYRSGQLPDRTARLHTDPGLTVDALLAAVPDHQVAELVELATRAHHAGLLLARLAPAPPARTGIAGPVFVEHWADGDLLLSAATAGTSADEHPATTLLDIKPVISIRDPDRVGRWLWQLLSYAWLDSPDHPAASPARPPGALTRTRQTRPAALARPPMALTPDAWPPGPAPGVREVPRSGPHAAPGGRRGRITTVAPTDDIKDMFFPEMNISLIDGAAC